MALQFILDIFGGINHYQNLTLKHLFVNPAIHIENM